METSAWASAGGVEVREAMALGSNVLRRVVIIVGRDIFGDVCGDDVMGSSEDGDHLRRTIYVWGKIVPGGEQNAW